MQRKRIAIGLLACCAFAALGFAAVHLPKGDALAPLTCTFLKVGKADAIVAQTQGRTMVIDAGEEDDGPELVTFLRERNVPSVDLLIITHFDRDHVGGADTLLEELPVARVLIPDYEGAGTEYADFLAALEAASLTPERVSAPVTLPFGAAVLSVEPPASYEVPTGAAEYDNNFSLVATISHGSNRMLFTGDIEKARIREMLSGGRLQECGFLKVPHHGIYSTALEELVRTVRPRYAVICSSDKNPAERATLELLKQYGASVLETRQGTITLVSDGRGLELRQGFH